MSGKEVTAGRVIADRYQLDQPLGRGAMGRIWSAEHLHLKSRVAIKFLDPEIAEAPEMFARFLQEAQSAAAVRSAHVVQIFDYGVDAGSPFIAMELLTGDSLEARLSARKVLPPREVLKIISEVARAIGNAHDMGVIHRDLKPGNIFIAREAEFEITKVLDFGIAKVMNPTQGSLAGTQTGAVLGTPQYMSPEQVRGSRSLDHRTDLWSLAVIAFECLTGELPFQGGGIGDLLVQICTCEPPVPSAFADVPPGFDAWFRKGVSQEASERFASAREMADALSAILFIAPASAVLAPQRSVPARSRWLSFGAPLVLLLAAAILALWPPMPEAPPASAVAMALASALALDPGARGEGAPNAQPPVRADAGAPRVAIADALSVPATPAGTFERTPAPAPFPARPASSTPGAKRPAEPRRAVVADALPLLKRFPEPARADTPSAATLRERLQRDAFSERQ